MDIPNDIELTAASITNGHSWLVRDRAGLRMEIARALVEERENWTGPLDRLEKPHCFPDHNLTDPEWMFIIKLFQRHGLPEPPVRLRDKLVTAFTWAWYGEAVDAILSPVPVKENA